jgi:hypothetical protein
MKRRILRPLPSKLAALSAIVLFASLPLQAQAQSWIAGGTVGTAVQNDYEVGGPIATRDDSDTGLRAFGGYLINPLSAVIVSYVDLGTA